MPVDPNDMLIFKLRGMHFEQPKQAKGNAQGEIPIMAKKEESIPQYAPEQKIEAAERVKQPEEVPAIENVQATANTPYKKAEQPSNATESYKKEETRIINEFIERQKEEEILSQHEISTLSKPGKRLTKTEKESMDSAKGLMCVNHPWRPAYAICDYCKRPFCYADLVEYNNRFYCLEDIDKVTKNASAGGEPAINGFILTSGAVFVANAIILLYFVYPQIAYLVGQIVKIGFIPFLNSMNYSYIMSILNFVAVLLGFAAGALLFIKVEKSMYSIFIGAIVLVISSYIYLISSVAYLLAVTVITFVAIGILAYGRVPISKPEEEIKPTDIEWPRLESF